MDARTRTLATVALALLAAVALLRVTGSARTEAPAGAAVVDGAVYRVSDADAETAGARALPTAVRRDRLRFAGSVHPGDRAVVEQAIAAARPEARALVDLVDGLVDVRIVAPRNGAAGTTTYTPGRGPRFDVALDLGRTYRDLGQRGVNRLVLHELAHVIDLAIVPADLDERLDRGVPPGLGCAAGVPHACAPAGERFAESFAKWATGDIGLALPIGYSVPPPEPTTERWGEPLAALARAASR